MHVSGTSLSLGWHSNRGNVRKPSIEMSLGLTADGGMPMGVKGTYFRLEVAGQSIVVEHLDGGFGDTVSIPWDGLDVFGRPVRGPVAATASTGYGFGASALAASSSGGGATGVLDYSEKDFGVWPPPGARAMASTREAIFFLKHMSHSLGDWVPRENLGNLSLDILHGYSEDGTLHLGSGAHTTASESGPTVRLLAGGGTSFAEDAGWLGVDLAPFPYIAEGPQGIFFTENETRVRLLQNDGGVRTFSGDINGGFAGDGQDATRGVFNHVRSLATDRDGNLYINDVDNFRIRRIDAKTHIISTVVGTGTRGFSPDGTLAVDTQLDSVSTLLIGVDGLLYFITRSTGGSLLVRRVSDGVVKTVAGGNDGPSPTFEGDARGINLRDFPHWLAQSADGSLYIAGYDSGETSDWVVRRIDVSGRVHLVAGGGASRNPFETDARKTCLAGITGLAVSPEGTVFVGESGGGCAVRGPGVRMVTADGSLGLFFGGVTAAPTTHTPPDGAAASTLLSYLGEVIMGRRGKLLVIHRGPSTLHEVSLPTANAARLVPSQDGEEVYAFDVKGRHLKTVSARTGLVLWQFAWGANGLESITDVDGDVTRVERNPDGSAKALVAQDGQRTELTLDAEGRVTRVTDAMGRFVEAAYFPRGLLREWKDENAHATTFEWDDAGNLVAETNARSGVKRLTKTNKGVDFTSAEGRVTRYLQERGPGGFTHFVTAYPDATQSSRSNDWGQSGQESTDGTLTGVQYQPEASRFGRSVEVPGIMSVRTPSGLAWQASSKRSTVTTPGQPLEVLTETDETTIEGKTWRSVYDASAKTYTSTTPLGRVSMTTVDSKQRPVRIETPGLLPLVLTWDARGRLATSTQGVRSQTMTYSTDGFPQSSTNAAGEVLQWTTDKTGRVTQVTRPDLKVTALGQDGVGNLVSVTPPESQAYTYGYSSVDELVSYAPPAVAGAAPESTTLDLDGLATSLTHRDGSQSTVTREASGRVTQVTTPWWTNSMTYIGTTGQLKSLTRGSEKLEWTYDGFLTTEEKVTGTVNATTQWGFDSQLRLASHAVGGTALALAYDDDSQVTALGPVALTYVPNTGQLATATVGSIATTFWFDGYGALATLSVPGLYSEAITYDSSGRITLINETVEGVASQFVYTNDSTGRLTSASKNGGPLTTWTYSANGNRLTENGVVSTFDVQDRLLTKGTTTYAWDAHGNRLTKTDAAGITRYVHDGFGALQSVTLPDTTVISYVYDGRQRRIARLKNGQITTRWVYDGQYRVVAELDAAGAVTSRFVYSSNDHSPDALIRGGVTYAYIKNHLGSVKLVVNSASGAVSQKLDYDAWGTVLSDTNPGFQPFGFAGGIIDADTKLTHFGFRDFDATNGTWLTPEPILRVPLGMDVSSREGVVLLSYAYALNSPIAFLDPDGRIVVFSGAPSQRLLRAVNQLNQSSRGRFLWNLLEESSTVFNLYEESLGWSRGEPIRGQCGGNGHERGHRANAAVDVRIDFHHQDMFNRRNPFESDLQLLAHELGHALDYFGGLPAAAGDEQEADWISDWVSQP